MNLESPTPIHVTTNNTPGQPMNPVGAAALAYLIGEHANDIDLAQIASGFSWLHVVIIVVPIIGLVVIYLIKKSTHLLNGAAAWIENAWTVVGEFTRATVRFAKAFVPPRFRPTPKSVRQKKTAVAKNQSGAKKTPSSRTSGSRRST
jgi:hypothetical protein